MWLFTQHGFVSVIADGKDREYVLVCGSLKHITNLRSRFSDALEDIEIIWAPAAEFPCRLRIKRQKWLALATDMAADVRYTNFQNAVSKNMEKVGPRFVVWLRDILRGTERILRP